MGVLSVVLGGDIVFESPSEEFGLLCVCKGAGVTIRDGEEPTRRGCFCGGGGGGGCIESPALVWEDGRAGF